MRPSHCRSCAPTAFSLQSVFLTPSLFFVPSVSSVSLRLRGENVFSSLISPSSLLNHMPFGLTRFRVGILFAKEVPE